MPSFNLLMPLVATALLCVTALRSEPALRKISDLPGPRTGAPRLQFVDARKGFLVCGEIWATEDGGTTWSHLRLPPHQSNLVFDAQFVSSGRGWIGLDGRIYVTNSFGRSWELPVLPIGDSHGSIETLFFLNDGRTGSAGGAQYQPETKHVNRPRYATFRRSGSELVDQPALFSTHDGGATWARQVVPAKLGYIVDHITFVDGRTGMATVQASVIKTDDGGRTWRTVLAGDAVIPDRYAQDLFVLDSQTAWVSFRWEELLGGILFRTADGGGHWKSTQGGMNSPDPRMSAVFPVHMWFWSRTNGLAMDNVGHHLYLTRNGGRTWQVLFAHRDVSTFCALDPEHVWVVSADSLFQLINLR